VLNRPGEVSRGHPDGRDICGVESQATRERAAYTVAEVMRPAVTTVETGGHLAAAAYLMNHASQTALVVIDHRQRPVAIITDADLLRAVAHGEDTGEALIADWMSQDPRTVHPDTSVFEAARVMRLSERHHLPVVSDGRVVGVVALGDIADALVRSIRLASAVVFVSDLGRSVDFYQALLRYTVTVSEPDTALLAGPSGSQLYLREVAEPASRQQGGVGVQWVVWTAGGEDDLDRCTDLLKERDAFVRRDVSEGITRLEGRDPDGVSVLITHPGPERSPRCLIPSRIRQP
jgi:CBS domain-containing protein